MKFEKDQIYKITEFPGGVLITLSGESLQNPGAKPLMMGNLDPMISYLHRYLWEREHGKSILDAHPLALKEANITNMLAPTKTEEP